ncbi:hypothetical protein ACQR5W_20940 [Xanthomonas sacchari]|uniref:hypothetical protein n=1 Tax=Xanthomonas sp. SHU 308 TaxID=1591201 RepID=UPI0012FF3BC1|nr:hypothetical protein [Xanthomonas sp. SHU 308]
MSVSLSPAKMYGHWTHCDPRVCEFQHGTTMIYIEYSEEYPMGRSLEDAQKTIDVVFEEVDYALAYASAISSGQHQDFWKAANRISLRQRPLIVYSVRYPLISDFPVYEISWNPHFEVEYGLAYSDDWVEEVVRVEVPDTSDFIKVRRRAPYQYEYVP